MELLKSISLNEILFLDIETVSQEKIYEDLNPDLQKLWDLKARNIVKEEQTPSQVYDRASIYAEFGKIVCIGVGFFQSETSSTTPSFRVKSIYDHDENRILNDFASLLNQHFASPTSRLCAHNGKEFDFPYIARRMLIHGITLPKILDVAGKKPWETTFLDTMELWKFGDFKNFTSLNLLASVFGLPTPKDDIDGSQVGRVFWEENDIERIARYCIKDVVTLARVFAKYRNNGNIEEDDIIIIE